MAAKIKKDDNVVVMTGRDAGPHRQGAASVIPKEERAIVQGVNMVRSATSARPSRRKPGSSRKNRRSTCPTSLLPIRATASRPASGSRFSMTAARSVSPSVPEI